MAAEGCRDGRTASNDSVRAVCHGHDTGRALGRVASRRGRICVRRSRLKAVYNERPAKVSRVANVMRPYLESAIGTQRKISSVAAPRRA
jgi:hypothetical protein